MLWLIGFWSSFHTQGSGCILVCMAKDASIFSFSDDCNLDKWVQYIGRCSICWMGHEGRPSKAHTSWNIDIWSQQHVWYDTSWFGSCLVPFANWNNLSHLSICFEILMTVNIKKKKSFEIVSFRINESHINHTMFGLTFFFSFFFLNGHHDCTFVT